MGRVSIHLDGEEVDLLYIDLRGADKRVQKGGTKMVRRSAKIINKEMRVDAAGHVGSYFTPLRRNKKALGLPSAVSDEMLTPLEAEIGLGPPGAGSLAHILAYGSVNNGPAYDYTAGPRRAMPIVEELFAQMAEDAVLGE